MTPEAGSPEAIEAARLVGERLAKWADRAHGGITDVAWQPRAAAPRGANRVAEHLALDLMQYRQVGIDADGTSPEGMRAIARALAVIASDLRDHPVAQRLAITIHDMFAGYSRAREAEGSTSLESGPESTLDLSGDLANDDIRVGGASLAAAIRFVEEVIKRRIADTPPGEQQESLALTLQGVRHSIHGLSAWSGVPGHPTTGAKRPLSSAAEASAMAAETMGADPGTPTTTLVAAIGTSVSTWVLVFDFLVGMAERLRHGRECNGYLFAASVAVEQRVRMTAIAQALSN